MTGKTEKKEKDVAEKIDENHILRIGKWLEQQNGLRIFFYLTFVVIAPILSFFADFKSLFGDIWKPTYSYILFVVIILVLSVLDFFHSYLAKKRLNDLQDAKRQIVNAKKLIRRAIDQSPTNYLVLSSDHLYDINSDGSVNYRKTAKIDCSTKPVNWAIIRFAIVGESQINDGQLDINVYTSEKKGKELAYFIYDEDSKRKEIAILLDLPSKGKQYSQYCVFVKCKGAYIDLVNYHPDFGSLTIENKTKQISVKFIAPVDFEFMEIKDSNGMFDEYQISDQEDGRSTLVWSGNDIDLGVYKYSLEAKKREP